MQYVPFNFTTIKHLRLKLALYYDNEFLDNVGKGSHATAEYEVKAIVHLAKTYFHGWQLESTIDLAVVHVGYANENLVMRSNDDFAKL